MAHQVEQLPFWKKIMYALGQFGWSLCSFGIANLIVYFYLPPDEPGRTAIFPQFIFQEKVVWILTIIGLIFAFGRLWDAVTDPIIATASDRSKFRLGKRRTFLLIGSFPAALFSFLAFYPVSESFTTNALWLWLCVFVFYLFLTIYVTPFFAWMSELGHSPNERLQLSTMISITWALGAAVGSQAPQLQTIFEGSGLSSVQAFQKAIAIFAAVSFVLMLLPVIFINEQRYCEMNVSSEGVIKALTSAFRNRNFLLFTLSDLTYWVALTFISTGLVYYVTVLLKLPKEFYSQLFIVLFGLSFIFYVPVNLIAKRIGKKKLLILGFIIFAVTFILVFPMGNMPISPHAQGFLIVAVAAIPMAIFGILPNAIIADIAEADGIKTGNFKAGIFFGARTFMSKMGQTIAALTFPSFIIIGAMGPDHPVGELGVRLTGIAALVFVALGLVLFLKYNEKEVLKTLATREKLSEEEMKDLRE